MRKRRGIDRVRWGLGRRSLLTCRYLTSGGIKTVGFLCSRDEPGGCPPTGQVVAGMGAQWARPAASARKVGRRPPVLRPFPGGLGQGRGAVGGGTKGMSRAARGTE